jgi:hypothetical protein
MVMLLRDFGPDRIILMTVCSDLDFHVILEGQYSGSRIMVNKYVLFSPENVFIPVLSFVYVTWMGESINAVF